ncbi:F-box/kelch-repeat protein At1g23390-like [Papaver somniferum]|uniref:F-box/kelch-repeat protein At1g23390-like n=1 Tax=Papaver somniferum TaxID=3469 RepID=UPI000E703212|nr:F-box/kelch-repeat protein At1g23390-like [Papaver somniferum]
MQLFPVCGILHVVNHAWLIVHMQNRRNLSSVVTRAYDPGSNVWIEFRWPSTTTYTSSLRSSHSTTLYMVTASKFSFSTDPLHETWHEAVAPQIWRIDPTVAIVGSYVIVAGGAYDFEEDPLPVELYDMASPCWAECQALHVVLRNSAAASWLSVDVLDQKMYILDKQSGNLCWFDPNTKIWSHTCGTLTLRPDPSIYFSFFAFAGEPLLLVGLMGDPENAKSLGIWEVNYDGFDCEEI